MALDLQDNRIANVDLLTNLTRLVFLDLSENQFPELTIPGGMTNLTTLRAIPTTPLRSSGGSSTSAQVPRPTILARAAS